jgi:PEP-CTERM motif
MSKDGEIMKLLSLIRNSMLILAMATGMAQAAPIVYQGTVTNGVTVYGDVPQGSISNPAQWDFWRFSGNAGDVVTITLNRTSNQMDPSVILYAGIGGDTAGLDFGNSNSTDGLLTFLAADDDSGSNVPAGPWFNALILDFVLPTTGDFTIGASDFASASAGPWTYALTVTGIGASSAVPEPGSLVLLGLGLVGLVAARKRKQA